MFYYITEGESILRSSNENLETADSDVLYHTSSLHTNANV
jgi:hypothetical protein